MKKHYCAATLLISRLTNDDVLSASGGTTDPAFVEGPGKDDIY